MIPGGNTSPRKLRPDSQSASVLPNLRGYKKSMREIMSSWGASAVSKAGWSVARAATSEKGRRKRQSGRRDAEGLTKSLQLAEGVGARRNS